jgi:lysophospholipase L1-like esterase
MRQLFRLLAINLGVFLGLFFTLMLLVSVGGDLVTLAKLAFGAADKRGRHELPAYKDKAYARALFEEQAKTREGYAAIVGWRRHPQQGKFVNIDAEGLRRHSLGRDDSADARRLGVFGGSTVWGTGVADNDTLPAQLDRIGDAYNVTNYGEGGWTSRQSLALLVNLANQERAPEVVVFYDGANDVEISCNLAFGLGYNETHEAPKLRRMTADAETRSYLYRNFVVPAFDTFRRVSGRDEFVSERRCVSEPERAVQVARTLFRNWELAKTITERAGGRFYAFLQPVASVGRPRVDYLTLDGDRMAQYRAAYPHIRRLIAEQGAGWAFDLSDSFDGDGRYYIDHAHVTPEGNAIIARRIRAAIEKGAP